MTERYLKLKKHLEALETFIASPAYVGYLAAREREIKNLEAALLDCEPLDRAGEIESYKQRGERRCLQQMLLIFEDARADLKDEIEDELESESKARQTKKV